MDAGATTRRQAPDLRFEALYYPDRLHPVNPVGDVGLITLWSPYRAVERKLRAEAPSLLDECESRIAVIANLYGDGMYAMFCNLLFNPQIRHLVAIGQDLGLGHAEEIAAFLERGLEDGELLGQPVKRVLGTNRCFPTVEGFDEDRLRAQLDFHHLGRLSSPGVVAELQTLLAELSRDEAAHREPARVRVLIPEGEAAELRPSRPIGQQVARRLPVDCWEELVVRVMRFGRRVELRKGRRLELLNAVTVIDEPCEDPPNVLDGFGFDIERFHAYQRKILDPVLPDGISYTYGNRLRDYFELGGSRDALDAAIAQLRLDPRTRGAYVSLWDDRADLAEIDEAGSKPCLTTLFFRLVGERLSLTATYRSHNLLTAWLENVYGLMAIQRHVAAGAGLESGSITVISHSLGIDPASPRFHLAVAIARGWENDDDLDRSTGKRQLRADPNGYFVVSVDRDSGVIVADHRFEGVLLKRYHAARAVTIEQQVNADMAVSLPSHAMWLGRELARAERSLSAVARPG
jgi:thymidylate synthase (methanogen type)